MLTLAQIEQIEQVVDHAGIFYSHLRDDLIDHICCEIEEEVGKGQSFIEAFERVRKKVGIQVLKNIQQDTLYLLDKNYRTMKNTSKILGNVALAIMAFGALFKIQHWPGAGVMLVLSFFILGVFFFPTAIYINFKETKELKGKLYLHLSSFVGGIILMAGILFKLMHWPGSSWMLLFGWLILIVLFLPVLMIIKRQNSKSSKEKYLYTFGIISIALYALATLFKVLHLPGAGALIILGNILMVAFFIPIFSFSKLNEEKYVTGRFIFLITASLYFVLFSSLLALNVSKDILGVFSRNSQQTIKANHYLDEKTAFYYNKLQDENHKIFADHLSTQGNEIIATIKDIEVEMVSLSDKTTKSEAAVKLESVNMIIAKDNWDVVHKEILENGKANALKESIRKFREILEQNKELNHTNAIALLETPDPIKPVNQYYEAFTWDTLYFYHTTIIGAITTLNQWEKNVRQVQLDAFRNLYYKELVAMRTKHVSDSLVQNLN